LFSSYAKIENESLNRFRNQTTNSAKGCRYFFTGQHQIPALLTVTRTPPSDPREATAFGVASASVRACLFKSLVGRNALSSSCRSLCGILAGYYVLSRTRPKHHCFHAALPTPAPDVLGLQTGTKERCPRMWMNDLIFTVLYGKANSF
jgi:hypothetical protein